jgi:RND superfamily putative drug exporter
MMLVGDGIFWVPKFMRKGQAAREEKARRSRNREEKERRMREARRPRYDKEGGRLEVDRKRVFYFSAAVDAAIKHAKAIILLALIISLPAVYVVYSIQPSYDFFTGMPDSEAKKGLDAMADGFGKSRGMETKVVIEMADPIYDNATGTYDTDMLSSVDGLAARITALGEVKRVDPSTYSEGSRIDKVDCWSSFGDEWKGQCLGSALGKYNRTVIITVTLKEAPFAKKSIDAVRTIRTVIRNAKESDPVLAGAKIVVGGATASTTDIENLINKNMQQMRIIVIVAIFVLLVIVLGSVLIPATAIVSIGLSISWTLAAALLIFQYVRGMPLLWLMPIILFVVLMGLGMDYNIFIITRMREEVMNGYSDRVAIRRSVERTGGIITACGAIMAGAFGSMMLSAMGLLQQFGFALFFAIVLDAFLIRIYVMPAVVVLLKKWNWWAPGPLQRVKRDKNGRVIIKGKGPVGREGEEE